MTVANLFTIIRLLLSPFLLWAFSHSHLGYVIIIWGIAALTDFLDGWAARKYNQISEFGKIIDPLADKLTVGFSLIGFMIWGKLPTWLVYIYILKEALQIIGSAYLLFYRKTGIQPSNLWGKAGTLLFFIGFFLHFWTGLGSLIFIGFGLLVSVIALFTYAKAVFFKIQR